MTRGKDLKKPKKQWKEGDTLGWNPKTNTGWRREGNKWVQYRFNEKTGRAKDHRIDTNMFSESVANTARLARFSALLPFRAVGYRPKETVEAFKRINKARAEDAKNKQAYEKIQAAKNKSKLKAQTTVNKFDKDGFVIVPKGGFPLDTSGPQPTDPNLGKYHAPKLSSKQKAQALKIAEKEDRDNTKRWREQGVLNKVGWGKRLAQSFDYPDAVNLKESQEYFTPKALKERLRIHYEGE